jgi:hypothetical protein
MITVTRCFWAAGVVLVATALSAAGDSLGVNINSGRTSALLPGEELAGYDAGRLATSRPYERGKVPVVFVHGLWGSPRNWDRMIADLDADPSLRELGSQLCRRPDPFSQAYAVLLSANDSGIFIAASRDRLPSSVGELAPGHPLLLTVRDLGIGESIRSHSVIADLRESPRPGGTDGIVPYSSSHLDGVVSELVVHGSHFCVNDPTVVAEVGRILIEHSGSESARSIDDQSSGHLSSAAPPGRQHGPRERCPNP